MKIFIDSAELDEIKKACEWGIIDGATTNPSLIKRAVDRRGGKISMEDYIIEILKTVP
ncbi:MAG: transaldolase, partial [archaeon GB-1867-097]|nr:transaldolase [Candidatus Culexmicrobium thermophilum]